MRSGFVLQLMRREQITARNKQRLELCLKELQALPDNTSMYKAVGKA